MQTQVVAREDLDFVHFNATYRHSTPYRERESARAREGGREGGRERGREREGERDVHAAAARRDAPPPRPPSPAALSPTPIPTLEL